MRDGNQEKETAKRGGRIITRPNFPNQPQQPRQDIIQFLLSE
jgi:hypothetical protein